MKLKELTDAIEQMAIFDEAERQGDFRSTFRMIRRRMLHEGIDINIRFRPEVE